jgi:itaconyl-CoA hydratase
MSAKEPVRHRFTRDDNLFEDFTVGETIVHPRGRTVSDGEHMLWTNFVLNTAQLHFNQKMCDDSPQTTFGGRRVVYGGIVFAYVAGLASEETEENAVAVLSYDEGRHLNPVFAGDTLFAESTVLSKSEDDPRIAHCGAPALKPGQAGVVKFLLRGKNQRGEIVLEITRELVILKKAHRP